MRNFGEVRGRAITGERRLEIEVRLIAEGHSVGNHSFPHPLLPKLDNSPAERDIVDTQMLIDPEVSAGSSRTEAMRPPHGARDDLALIDQHRLHSIAWKIDSEDRADPLPPPIVNRVVSEAEKCGRGIALLHDIHACTVGVLPDIIDELTSANFVLCAGESKMSSLRTKNFPSTTTHNMRRDTP